MQFWGNPSQKDRHLVFFTALTDEWLTSPCVVPGSVPEMAPGKALALLTTRVRWSVEAGEIESNFCESLIDVPAAETHYESPTHNSETPIREALRATAALPSGYYWTSLVDFMAAPMSMAWTGNETLLSMQARTDSRIQGADLWLVMTPSCFQPKTSSHIHPYRPAKVVRARLDGPALPKGPQRLIRRVALHFSLALLSVLLRFP